MKGRNGMESVLSLYEFLQRFPSEEECFQHLVEKRWPNGFRCPKCGNDAAYFIEKHRRFQCTRCRRQTSVTAGTVFHKLPPSAPDTLLGDLSRRHLEERHVRHGTATETRHQVISDGMAFVAQDTVRHGFFPDVSPHRRCRG